MRIGGRRAGRARRSNVQVRGCGCCLPLALGMLAVPVAGLVGLWRMLNSGRG